MPLEAFRVGPQTPLLQSSEIPNLCLTVQSGNFWLTLCYPSCLHPGQREKINLNFIFTFPCGTSKGFTKAQRPS